MPSFEKDVCTLVDLLEKGDLYPSDCSEKRKFKEDFWWNHVRPSKDKVGSAKAKMKEEVKAAPHVQRVLDILSYSEEQPDIHDFELEENDDEDTVMSVCSSTMRSERGEAGHLWLVDEFEDEEHSEEDWETVNEAEQQATIGTNH